MKHSNNIHTIPHTSRLCGTNPETGEQFMVTYHVIYFVDDNNGLLHTELISVGFTGSVPPANEREGLLSTIRQTISDFTNLYRQK